MCRGAHPVHKPVRCELGFVLGHDQVMSNDQVGDDFTLALELGRLGREALELGRLELSVIWTQLISMSEAVFGLSVQVDPRGSPA